MPLIINGANFSPSGTISLSDAELQKIYCNDILVWQKYIDSKGIFKISGTGTYLPVNLVVLGASVQNVSNISYARDTMSGGVLSWSSTGAIVKALCDCKVTMSGTLSCWKTGGNVSFYLYYYKNSTLVQTFASGYLSSTTGTFKKCSLNHTIALSKDDTLSIRVKNESNFESAYLSMSGSAIFSGVAT